MVSEASSGQNLAFVKDSLFRFIKSHIPNADLSVIDDIILSYVYSTFEEGHEELYESINDIVPDFQEMISAYIADFITIDSRSVCLWMLEIVNHLAEMAAAKNGEQEEPRPVLIDCDVAAVAPANGTAQDKSKKGSRSNSFSEEEKEKSASTVYEDEDMYKNIDLIQEMFPDSNPVEIKHCLSIALGDVERATATLMHRRDNGEALECAALPHSAKVQECDDTQLRSRIIARYAFIDQAAILKEHKPIVPKEEPKKMVRYRNGRIVSLKGERYTEVPKSDDESVKKSSKKYHP